MRLVHLPVSKQNVSLAGMKNREERSKHFFDSGPLMEEDEELALYDKVRGFSAHFVNVVVYLTLEVHEFKDNIVQFCLFK